MTCSAFRAAYRFAGGGRRLARAGLPKQGTRFAQSLNRNRYRLPVLGSGRCNPTHGL
jgi:hypothetical protein